MLNPKNNLLCLIPQVLWVIAFTLALLFAKYVFGKVEDENIIVDNFDTVEIAHHYSGHDGKLVFTQYIWWGYNAAGDYGCQLWRLHKPRWSWQTSGVATIGAGFVDADWVLKTIIVEHEKQWIRENPGTEIIAKWNSPWTGGPMNPVLTSERTGRWLSIFVTDGRVHKVYARHKVVSWKDYDRELKDRVRLPKSARRGLGKGKRPGQLIEETRKAGWYVPRSVRNNLRLPVRR